MIDFRYHLVSIVAVFLALAIGIVLGSTELQGSTLDALRTASNSLRSQLSAVSAQRDGLVQQASANDAFLQTAEPKLLSGMLTGKRIVHRHRAGRAVGDHRRRREGRRVRRGHGRRHGRAPAEVQRPLRHYQVQPGRDQHRVRDDGRHRAHAPRRPADRLPAGGRPADRHRGPEPGQPASSG